MAWRKPLPTSHSSKDLDTDDLNGGALVMDEEDPELSRKKRELQEIEERIIHKKAAIAVKTVEMFTKNIKSPGDERSDLCPGKTLRDRVMEILKQRHTHGFSLKSSKERLKPTAPRNHGLLQEHHPLKARVMAAMKHRVGDRCVFPTSREVSDIPLTPPSQSFTAPVEDKGTKTGLDFLLQMVNKGANANLNPVVPDVPAPPSQEATSQTKENDGVHRGFDLFLKVLNKGVDVQLLNSVVNNVHPSSERSKSDPPLGSKGQDWNSEASNPGSSGTSSTELMLDSLSRKAFSSDAEEKKNDRRDQNVESSSQSACRLSEEKEGGETPKADQKLEQLQSIVETLGLNLDMQELNRLTDRTQERLYGKKNEGRQRPDGGGKESRQSGPRKDYSKSRSPSSYSSSSGSFSRSPSRSPSYNRHSRDSKEEGSRREGVTHGDRNEVRTETHPPPHPAAFAHPHSLLQQQSYYTDCYSNSYRDATSNVWTSNQNYGHAPSLHPCQQPVTDALKRIPVSSVSEGQCEVVNKPSDHSVLQLPRHRTRRGKRKRKTKRGSFKNKRKRKALAAQNLCSTQAYGMEASYTVASKVVALQNDLQHLLDKESDEEKPQPTDEEIKANLRKKLQAFNQKAKQTKQPSNSEVNQPSNSQTSELG